MESVWATLDAFTSGKAAARNKTQLDAAIKDHALAVSRLMSAHREVVDANTRDILQVRLPIGFFIILLTLKPQRLDPSTDSIAFLAILLSSLELSTPPSDIDRSSLLDETLRFLLAFDTLQIRYVGSSLRKLLEHVLTGRLFTPVVAVEAAATAMLRIDPSGSMFTSTHLLLAKFAYTSTWVEPALKVLDRDITFFPGMAGQKDSKLLSDSSLTPAAYISVDTGLTEPVKSATVLEYNLVSGLCYMARRDWVKSHRALERVITHPSKDKGVSKIMDEAYKVWLLVGLLKDGKEPSLPAYTAQSAKNTFNTLGAPYKNVANQFSTTNVGQLIAEIGANRQVWADDGNEQLMVEVIAAYQKWQIMNLRDIYKQISISQLRQATLSAETGEILKDDDQATHLVRDMIDSGLLKGELIMGNSGDDSYLLFHEDSNSLTEVEFAKEIALRHHNIESLGKQYHAANERLSGSKEYVRHMVREQKRAEKDSGDPGVGFDSQIEDEDLMTGILANS
ncbi:hypothetical protein FZEAL_7926 [Fusarium zealandicum]|uniref:COP9 signalosome complex subunit 3 N-terminal helical repeats domain-containing protein n=1 Tax=Fusarium zealandicum TaxID=1053134 RepID=A0A8H4UFL7_9HYPO|nr:hypothetical protein FZEAL_7926 [Fusarium zealandicum]